MSFLRHAVVQRTLSVGLLLSLGLWLAAPAYASPTGLAEDLGMSLGFDADLDEALAGATTPEAFVEALAARILEGTDDDALRDVLVHDPDVLLALLYGHLLQALSHHDALRAVPTVSAAASAASPPVGAALDTQSGEGAERLLVVPASGATDRAVLPVALLTAAQPLGP